MKRTVLEYIDNPMGTGSSALASRHVLINDYSKRLAKLSEQNDLTPIIYYDKPKDEYYFHFKIPSESKDRGNTYDVVIKLSPDKKENKKDSMLTNYTLQFFSNSPSFIYTFAYSYDKNDMLIKFLAKEKYDKMVLSKAPNIRNPQQAMTYEKTTIFALLYMIKDRKYLNKLVVDSASKKFSEKEVLSKIRNDEQVKIQIKKEQNRVKRDAEKAKRQELEATRMQNNMRNNNSKKIAPKRSNISKPAGRITPKPKIKPKAKIRPRR